MFKFCISSLFFFYALNAFSYSSPVTCHTTYPPYSNVPNGCANFQAAADAWGDSLPNCTGAKLVDDSTVTLSGGVTTRTTCSYTPTGPAESCATASTNSFQYDCTGSCPAGTYYDHRTGGCKKDECTKDSDNFVGYGPDGRTPKCHDEGLPDNCGYINGVLYCWPPEDDPPDQDDPDVDPDNPPSPDGAENVPESDTPIDEDDPLAEEPPEEGDPRVTTGGGDCKYAPRCQGDQIDCSILYQAWKTRCEAQFPDTDHMDDLPDPDHLFDDLDELNNDGTQEFSDYVDNLPEALGVTNMGGANIEGTTNNILAVFDSNNTCSPYVFNFPHMGQVTLGCEWADLVRPYIGVFFAISTVLYLFSLVFDRRDA